MLSKWGKRLLLPIEMKLHEGKFTVGKGWVRQEIILVCLLTQSVEKAFLLVGKATLV